MDSAAGQPLRAALRGLLASPIGCPGLVLVLLIVAATLAGPVLQGVDPMAQVLAERLLPPSAHHPLGTDSYGRDILARALAGGAYSLAIVALVIALAAPVGMLYGVAAGYAGGVLDRVLMRIADVFLAFPRLVLALAIAAVLGAGMGTLILAIGITGWPAYARIARAQAAALRSADFVLAAETLGVSRAAIVWRHLMPQVLPAIVVRAALDAPGVVLIAAGLGFLGAGLTAGTPEWGAMIADGKTVIFDHWWVSACPGLFLVALSLGLNLVADALRDHFSPHAR
ncbi:MAG: ABC transporter permease [Comamonas sp.]